MITSDPMGTASGVIYVFAAARRAASRVTNRLARPAITLALQASNAGKASVNTMRDTGGT